MQVRGKLEAYPIGARPILFGECFVGAKRLIIVDRRVGEFEPEGWFRWSQSAGAVWLFPEIQMAEDVLNYLPVLDQRDQPHFPTAFRAEQRIGIPDLLDEFTPGAGGDFLADFRLWIVDCGLRIGVG